MDRATRLQIARTLRAAAVSVRAEAEEHSPFARWKQVTLDEVRANPALAEELFSLIDTAYRPIGGHFKLRSPMDLVGGEVTVYEVADLDNDPSYDAVNLVDYKPAGEKYVGMGHDGSRAAKEAVLQRWARGVKVAGIFAEVSDALAHVLLTKFHVPVVEDENTVRRVLKKDVMWIGAHPEGKYPWVKGWYVRGIGGHDHMKVLVGRPRLRG